MTEQSTGEAERKGDTSQNTPDLATMMREWRDRHNQATAELNQFMRWYEAEGQIMETILAKIDP